MLDERNQQDVEEELRALKFATNADLSLAFVGEREDEKDDVSNIDDTLERNSYSYLLDLPRSLSLSDKWRKLEREVEELMAQYVAKLGRTVWDEWLDDLDQL